MAESKLRNEALKGLVPEEKQDLRTYSPLTLAYLGDAVYELADGRNVAMFATVVKSSQYGDIKTRIDARFFIITDWERK